MKHSKYIFDKLIHLDEDQRLDVLTFLHLPTTDNWEDIKGVVIRRAGRTCTLWQWVRKIDPSFPIKGRRYDKYGAMVQDWERVPSIPVLLKAISVALEIELDNVQLYRVDVNGQFVLITDNYSEALANCKGRVQVFDLSSSDICSVISIFIVSSHEYGKINDSSQYLSLWDEAHVIDRHYFK